MASLKLKLGQDVDINKVDSTIIVGGSKGKLGELVFSKGSVEWWPASKKVNCFTFTWAALAKVLEEQGTPKRVEKTKASAKPALKSAGKPKPATTPAKTTKAATKKAA